MGRIKIDDLPEEMEVSKDEMKKVIGGGYLRFNPRTGGVRGSKGGLDGIVFSACWEEAFCL